MFRFCQFPVAGRRSRKVRGDAMRDLTRHAGVGREIEMDEQHRLRAFGQDGNRFALTCGLESAGYFGGVEFSEDGALAKDLDGLEDGVAATEVGDPQLVDEVNALVRAGEGCGRIGHAEKEGCRKFRFRGQCGEASSSDENDEDECDESSAENASCHVRYPGALGYVVRRGCGEL